jgi:hypothetical protein
VAERVNRKSTNDSVVGFNVTEMLDGLGKGNFCQMVSVEARLWWVDM